jgi:hypothetical protein
MGSLRGGWDSYIGDGIPCPCRSWRVGADVNPHPTDGEPGAVVPFELLLRAIKLERSLHEAFFREGLARRANAVLICERGQRGVGRRM